MPRTEAQDSFQTAAMWRCNDVFTVCKCACKEVKFALIVFETEQSVFIQFYCVYKE